MNHSIVCGMRDRLKTLIDDLSDKALKDALTGVKSKHAFLESQERLDQRIEGRAVVGFAIALFDLNGLKEVNDSQGHEAGDQYIKEACELICARFKHSPVFRIGGDEFLSILEGTDYEQRDELISGFEKQMDENHAQGKVSIASGYSDFDPALDKSSQPVMERADAAMYERKRKMKETYCHLQ